MELVRVDVNTVRDQVLVAVEDLPQVIAAYLFGSATGLCRPDSDLDIALFVTDVDPNSREADHVAGEVALKLAPLGEHPFDVNIVDPANTIFAFRIISQGIPLVVRDNASMHVLLERVSREYADIGYYYRRAIQDVLKGATSRDT